MPEQKIAKFNLLKKANEIADEKGNVLICSHQEIEQPSGSKSQHLVISKVRRNIDGSQAGKPKSLFIPVALVPQMIKSIELLLK